MKQGKTKGKAIRANLLEALYSLTPSQLIKDQFPVEVVSHMSSHTRDDQTRMSDLSRNFIDCEVNGDEAVFRIDFGLLRSALKNIEESRRIKQLEDEFLLKGASNECMCSLFGLNRDEVVLRRKLIANSGDNTHITSSGSAKVSKEHAELIGYEAKKLRDKQYDERQMYLELHDIFKEPISRLWNAVNSADSEVIICKSKNALIRS